RRLRWCPLFPYTTLFRSVLAKEESDPSPLRGGLWIGLLERTAIVASLWAGWPEGIAIVLAVKGLGRFSELKNHRAAEQFILGTRSEEHTSELQSRENLVC